MLKVAYLVYFVFRIRREMLYMNAEEKRNHLRSKVQASYKGIIYIDMIFNLH
jgi:hypothetical protein